LSRHQIAFAAWTALARLRRAVKPQSRLRRAEGAGLDGECADRAIMIVAATYKGHSALFDPLWIPILCDFLLST
jgi:hypothetical protein